MDLEGIMLSKISQTEKDKYRMILHICESKDQSKWIKQTNSDTESKVMVARWARCGRLPEKGEGIEKYKAAVTK